MSHSKLVIIGLCFTSLKTIFIFCVMVTNHVAISTKQPSTLVHRGIIGQILNMERKGIVGQNRQRCLAYVNLVALSTLSPLEGKQRFMAPSLYTVVPEIGSSSCQSAS